MTLAKKWRILEVVTAEAVSSLHSWQLSSKIFFLKGELRDTPLCLPQYFVLLPSKTYRMSVCPDAVPGTFFI